MVYINTASFQVATRVRDGLGIRPFSVAMTPDGRFGLVNNAGDSTLSVLDIAQRRIVGRLGPTGGNRILLQERRFSDL